MPQLQNNATRGRCTRVQHPPAVVVAVVAVVVSVAARLFIQLHIIVAALVWRQARHHATIIHLGCIQEDHAANATVKTKVMVGIFKTRSLGP